MKINQATRITPILAVALVLAAAVALPSTVSAEDESATVTASIGDTISMAVSGNVSLSITPTGAGSISTNSHTVTVTTNNSTGYALTLATSSATRDLVSGVNTISPSSGTFASPATGLAANTWGYRVDGVGEFGAGPSSAVTNQSSSALSWAGVPASGDEDTIKTTSTASTGGDATTFWYGANATTAKPSGNYTQTVVYTATTN